MRVIATELVTSTPQKFRQFVNRRRFFRSVRSTDTFIVTFPKSGTNWVGFFLANITYPSIKNRPEELTLRSYREFIPDINVEYFSREGMEKFTDLDNPRIFTVHAPFEPAFPNVIYLVRDPRDALLSYYYYHKRNSAEFAMNIDEFIKTNAYWPCDWGEHVSGWIENLSATRVLMIRYEDLHLDPLPNFKKIVEFCGIEASLSDIEDAISLSSFDNMRQIEERYGIRDVQGDRSIPFTRRGKAEAWRDELSEDLTDLIELRYSNLMARFGYRPRSESAKIERPIANEEVHKGSDHG